MSFQTKTLHHQTIRARNQRRRTLQEKDRCMAAMCGSVPQLFESVLIITLEPVSSTSGDSDRKPMITYRFPEDEDAEEVPPELFFPDYSRAQRRKYCNEEFVMALTDVKGARKNAYCLKFLNSRDDHKKGSYPGVLVVISPIRNDIFYLDLARNIHKYLERGTIRLTCFLEAIFNHSYPQVKGASLVVVEKCSDVTGRPDLIEIFNQGTILGRNGLAKIVERISPEITTCIIASLLGEQRILLADHTVCAVSKLVQSMEALIQPFCWPHVFIPAVPDNLIDLCHNPTPYLMGILRNNLVPIRDLITATADTENIEQMDFVFIDADTGLIYPPPEPYVCNTNIVVWKQQCAVRFCKRLGMPKKVSMALITGLRAALVDGTGASADLRIENMMLIWYASLFGHYKNITCQCDWGGQQFKQRLVENQSDKVIRPYLSYLTETVMFHEWIMKRSESTFAEPTDPLPGTEDYLNRQIDKLYSAGVNCFTTKRLAKLFTKVTAVLRVKK
ncbi:DENN domain protein [Trichostrongylus colubriformis]|uniref:DENN domain protein n=1 Tax=Trichostrongylus colubriformis TaxID=6319 RepID=A0AAN8FBG0_TRICO